VTLNGWLSPLIWSLIRFQAARVAAALVQAAEQAAACLVRRAKGIVVLILGVARLKAWLAESFVRGWLS